MDKCGEFSRQTLLILNAIAIVKSVDFIIVGATLNVLETLVLPEVKNITIDAADHSGHLTGSDLYVNTWLFMLVIGPIIFIVSLLGWFGAKKRHRLVLAFFIILQALLIITIIVLSVTKIPGPLINPTPDWHPLSTFILSGVLIVGAMQGLMILLSMSVISSLREQDKTQNTPRGDDAQNKPSQSLPSNGLRRNSWR